MINQYINLYFAIGSRYFLTSGDKVANPCSEYALTQRVYKELTGIAQAHPTSRAIAFIPLGQDGFESWIRFAWNAIFPSHANASDYGFDIPTIGYRWNTRAVATHWSETLDDGTPRWGNSPSGRYNAHLHYTQETWNAFIKSSELESVKSVTVLSAVQDRHDVNHGDDPTLDFFNDTVLPWIAHSERASHIDFCQGYTPAGSTDITAM